MRIIPILTPNANNSHLHPNKNDSYSHLVVLHAAPVEILFKWKILAVSDDPKLRKSSMQACKFVAPKNKIPITIPSTYTNSIPLLPYPITIIKYIHATIQNFLSYYLPPRILANFSPKKSDNLENSRILCNLGSEKLILRLKSLKCYNNNYTINL